jgi:hypothetical protein
LQQLNIPIRQVSMALSGKQPAIVVQNSVVTQQQQQQQQQQHQQPQSHPQSQVQSGLVVTNFQGSQSTPGTKPLSVPSVVSNFQSRVIYFIIFILCFAFF